MSDAKQEFQHAVQCHRAGDFAAAEAAYRAILARNPDLVEVYCNLGDTLRARGRLEEAAVVLEHALTRRPDLVQGHLNLAGVRRQQGRLAEAAACLEAALRRKPYLAEAHCNLGVVRDALGQGDRALASFETAVDLNPRLAEGHFNLGNHYRRHGKVREAETCYRTAIDLRPEYVEALNNLGTLLRETGRADQARACFAAAIEAAPESAESHYNLGLVLEAASEIDDALEAYERACARDPRPAFRIKRATALPPIPASVDEIAAARRRLMTEVAALRRQPPTIADPLTECDWTSFYLAYHGENDRALQQALSAMYVAACPRLAEDLTGARGPDADGRIRLGFISSYFKDHTIGALFRGVIAAIDRERFAVTVFQIGPADDHDPVAAAIRENAESYVTLPRDLFTARRMIAVRGLDALLYTDIGMDPATYFLAHARLAPVQMATWGHPLTTGIGTIDYFVSAAGFEPEDAADAYSERLAVLDRLLLCMARPGVVAGPRDRDRLGLARDRTAYLSVQSLFKYHPDFDRCLVEILRRDPDGHLYLLSGHNPNWNRLLRQRLQPLMPEISERMTFLPHLSREDFIRVMGAADVVLDTPVFSGGKTSLECLAAGTPLVTLPSPYLRGRLTYGFYRRMGIEDCVARTPETYIEIAAALGRDRDRRAAVTTRLRENNEVLFDDSESVRIFEDFVARIAAP